MATPSLVSSPYPHRSGARRVSEEGRRVDVRRLNSQGMIACCEETDIDLESLKPCLGLNQCRNENKIKKRERNMMHLYMTLQPVLLPYAAIAFPPLSPPRSI